MEAITLVSEPLCGDDVRVRDGVWHVCDDVVHATALSALVATNHLTHEQRHVGCVQAQILDQVIVNGFHTVRPVALSRICFALMQKDTFDDAHFLGFLTHFDQPSVRVSSVRLDRTLHIRFSTVTSVILFFE